MFRYIGNKSKLLPEILQSVKEAVGDRGTVVDLMSGTGTVALELRRNGYTVIASDVMTYSKHHLVTGLLINKAPSFDGVKGVLNGEHIGYIGVLEYLNNLEPIKGFFFNEFSPEGTTSNGCISRKYFTSKNAQKIDAIRNEINKWIDDKLITSIEESVLKHTLIMAVNRIANISGTYGYYLSGFKKNSLDEMELLPTAFEENQNIHHIVLQGFAEDLAHTITADVCYIDPPYMKRQYAANYHILETIARGDFPDAVGKSGLRDWWDQHSKLCTKTRSMASFDKIFADMNCKKFIISYSEDGLLTIEQLVELCEKYGYTTFDKINYKRFRSNQSTLPKDIKEYIIRMEKY